MKIYIMVSDDVIFKPRVLYRILQRRGKDICGVAEVRDRKTKKNKKNNQPTYIQFWGIKGFLILGFYSYFLRVLKYFPLPPFIKSRQSNKYVCSLFKLPSFKIAEISRTIAHTRSDDQWRGNYWRDSTHYDKAN